MGDAMANNEGSEFLKKTTKAAWELMKQTSPLGMVFDVLEQSVRKTEEAQQGGDLSALTAEAARQDLTLRIAEAQARVAQELAIAQRIAAADQVIIEEYYETQGSGNVGLKVDEKGATLGVGGATQRVTRRVYKFKGGSAAAIMKPPTTGE
jgi:hypothetical protein